MASQRSSRSSQRNGHPARSKREAPPDPLQAIAHLSDRSIQETDTAIKDREKLTQRFLREISKEIAEALRMLRFLGDPWKRGDRTDYEVMRISLDKALTARKKERRERLLQHWKDLLALRERQLDLLRENIALSEVGRDDEEEEEEDG